MQPGREHLLCSKNETTPPVYGMEKYIGLLRSLTYPRVNACRSLQGWYLTQKKSLSSGMRAQSSVFYLAGLYINSESICFSSSSPWYSSTLRPGAYMPILDWWCSCGSPYSVLRALLGKQDEREPPRQSEASCLNLFQPFSSSTNTTP